jgi:hypothetical protein
MISREGRLLNELFRLQREILKSVVSFHSLPTRRIETTESSHCYCQFASNVAMKWHLKLHHPSPVLSRDFIFQAMNVLTRYYHNHI